MIIRAGGLWASENEVRVYQGSSDFGIVGDDKIYFCEYTAPFLQRCCIWSPQPVALPEAPKISYYTTVSATQRFLFSPL